MELVVFDLDGTLLNGESVITDYTRDTLAMLADKGVAYTVATGRTLHASRELLSGHGFDLPQVYKNGVVIWHPEAARFTHRNVLTPDELAHVAQACLDSEIAPFVFTLEGHDGHAVYHAPLHSDAEKELKGLYLDHPAILSSFAGKNLPWLRIQERCRCLLCCRPPGGRWQS